jgi:hypothetical protein
VLRVPRFIVVSGGEAGAFYARQLLRAAAAGRLSTDGIVVVDRDPSCAAARIGDPRVRVDVSTWDAWLDAHLASADPADHLVPYHWAPHILLGWLERALAAQGAAVARGGALPARGFPMERDTSGGDRALSYATWVCPASCIEPVLCPHTRGPKDWSLAGDLEQATPGLEPVVFRCLHLVWGVGTIPVAAIQAARRRLLERAGGGRYLVATSSHCHALASVLSVGARAGGGPA